MAKKSAPKPASPPPGTACQEASPVSGKYYIACGRRATKVVKNSDPDPYAMCDACADHNVKNRGARLVEVGEKYKLAVIAQPEREELLGEEELPEVEAAPLPSDDELSKVRALAELQVALEARIAKGQEYLKKLALAHKDVSESQLPLAMKALGLEKFSLVGGTEIVVKRFIAASIPKPMTARAFEIVEKLGEGSIIKHAITITFGRDEDAWAAKFMRDMAARKKPLNHVKKDWIEPPTLGKFVRDRIAALRAKNEDPYLTLPKEVFGIYEGEKAEVELPK